MRSGPEAVVIADDLTGAADTGVQFAALGAPVYLMPLETLWLDRPWMSEAAGISTYTSSRQLPSRAAAERLRRVAPVLADLRPRRIYKKIDSCLRGNLGAEIDVLLDLLGLDAALIAPALPAQGRITVGGVQLVRGVPLAETEFAKDPIAPINSSVVAEILVCQSRHPVGGIRVDEYRDPDRLEAAVQRELGRGCRLIVCDAAEQAHLDQLAGLVVRSAGRLLPVGSAGLAASLAGQFFADPAVAPLSVPAVDRLLLVCGTGSRVTRGQLDILFDRYPGTRAELKPEWLIAASPEDRHRRAGELLDAWTGGILALTIGLLPSEGLTVTPAQAAAGLAVLTELASQIVRAGRADGLFLSGGETADAFLRASGGEAIALEQELLPGLVLGRLLGGPANDLPVVTKAGAFGEKRTLVALYERLSAGAGS
jgi:D-threonate/D-erythronate kinase